jgi:hypothetical protein
VQSSHSKDFFEFEFFASACKQKLMKHQALCAGTKSRVQQNGAYKVTNNKSLVSTKAGMNFWLPSLSLRWSDCSGGKCRTQNSSRHLFCDIHSTVLAQYTQFSDHFQFMR